MYKLHFFLVFFFHVLILNATSFFVTNEQELNESISIADAGDRIIMEDGIWNDIHISINGSGTLQSPIYLEAETRGEVFMEGNSKLSISGNFIVVDGLFFRNGFIPQSSKSVIEFRTSSSSFANNCRITNCSIIGYNPASNNTEYKYVSLYGTNNRLDHCHFENKTNKGATVVIWTDTIIDNHIVDYNYFGPRPILGENGAESIRCGDSNSSLNSSNSIIEKNLFDRCNGEIEIISNKSSGNQFRFNTFLDCIGLLTLRHGNNSEVYGNFFLGNYSNIGQGGVRIIGEGHKVYNNYFQDLNNGSSNIRGAIVFMNGEVEPELNGYAPVKNILLANNTFVNCKTTLIFGGGKNSTRIIAPDECSVNNNILYSTQGDNVLISYIDTPTSIIYKSNISFGDPLGIIVTSGIDSIDPLLQLPSNDSIWRPAINSPIVDGADTTGLNGIVSLDFDGQLRDQVVFDIGGDELSNETINNFPLTISDVGPLPPDDTLPLTLISFISKKEEKFNLLNWKISTNELIETISLERKLNSQTSFKNLQSFQISNTTQRDFTYKDEQKELVYYYRLKIEGTDNLYDYSKIIHIHRNLSKTHVIDISPSPAIRKINFTIKWTNIPDSSNNSIVLFNSMGKYILKKDIERNREIETYELDPNNLITGTYFLSLISNGEIIITEKIVFYNK